MPGQFARAGLLSLRLRFISREKRMMQLHGEVGTFRLRSGSEVAMEV